MVHDFLVIQLGLFDHNTMGVKIMDITDARGIWLFLYGNIMGSPSNNQ